ncbi:unnamed protein product [Haemonchus placei]|uniref:POU-specific domain-containing protein n=1 Tax=Haemonchus placei TaxID=6290 RepID=A0A0N4X0G9_HAEPC|nr:unnamed protein product [Haemonchus placei]
MCVYVYTCMSVCMWVCVYVCICVSSSIDTLPPHYGQLYSRRHIYGHLASPHFRSSSSSGCSSSATCELYDLATAHALLARQQQLIQQANFPLISSAELVQQLAHHQQLQQLQHHIQGIVHHNLVGDMALVSHPATATAVGAAQMYAGNVVKQEKKSQVPTAHQVLQMQQQQLPQVLIDFIDLLVVILDSRVFNHLVRTKTGINWQRNGKFSE